MKSYIAIVLAILIFSPSLNKACIYIGFKWNQEEIVKNLCVQRDKKVNTCNGNCHLAKKMKVAEESEQKQNSESLKKMLDFQFLPHENGLKVQTILFCATSKNTKIHPKKLPIGFVVATFHPPTV